MRRFVVAATICTSAALSAHARAETLTLDEAVRLGRASSPRIQETDADVEGSRASVSIARSGYLPDANVSAAVTGGFGGAITGALGVRGIQGSPFAQHYGAGIEGTWTVYDFGRTSARVDAALAGVDAAKARKVLSSRTAALEVVQAFGAVLMAEEDIRATGAIIELRRRAAEAARALAAAGLRSDMDALLATAGAEEAGAALAGARADVDAARLRLSALLGRPISEATTLTVPTPTSSEADDAAAGAPLAPKDPLHAVASAEADRAAALEQLTTAEHLPRLLVAGSAGYAHRSTPDDPGYWAAGAAIVVPLLAFVPGRARAREASASARAAAARASQADIELKAQIGREVAALRALSTRLAAADASVVAAKAALDAAEARYRAGQLSFAEADVARDAFVRNDSGRRRLGIQGALALARLRIVLDVAGT